MNAAKPKVGPIVPALIVLASAVSILSSDLYVPSMPHLVEVFATDASTVQLTMSLNFLAFALAMLLWGPLSDRYGRRPVYLVAFTVFSAVSLAAPLSPSIDVLIGMRIVQGAAASAEVALGLAIIKDLYDEAGAVRILALLGVLIAVVPAVGPVIGGFIFAAFGWEANFWVVGGLAAVAVAALAKWLPESNPEIDAHAMRPRRIVANFAHVLTRPNFTIMAALCGTAFAMLMAFVTAAPFVYITLHGVTPQGYGIYQGAIVLPFMAGSFVTGRFVGSLGADRLLAWGVGIGALGSAALLALVLTDSDGPVSIAIAMSGATAGLALVFAIAPVKALNAVDGKAGSSAAALGAVESTIAALAALAVGEFNDGSARPLAWTVFVCGLAGLVLLRAARRSAGRR